MSDFEAFSEDIAVGMEYLEHHGILGQKWGKLNGPPYPLGSGKHSAGEKKAAEAAGVKVGSDSGKGSIENVKKKKKKSGVQNAAKKEMTPEEKREAALEAVRTGDKKKIAKYMDQLSTQELQDAENRVRAKTNITREDPNDRKASKAEMEKMEAIRSGDKEKVRQYADQMSYQELSEAMNKIDLTKKLNYEPPPKTTMDKIDEVMNNVNRARDWAEKGISAYNVMAKVYNSTHKDGVQWPEIHPQNQNQNKEKSKEQDVAKKLMDQAMNDVKKTVQENRQMSYEEKSKQELKNKKTDYKNQKKYEEWVEKQEAKKQKDKQTTEELNQKLNEKAQSEKQDHEYIKKEGEGEDAKYTYKEDVQAEKQRKYTPEQAPQVKSSFFNKAQKEPTEEQKRLVEEARKSDDYYLEQLKNISDTKINNNDSSWENTWNSVSQVQSNRSINDDLTPAEEAFLKSFM